MLGIPNCAVGTGWHVWQALTEYAGVFRLRCFASSLTPPSTPSVYKMGFGGDIYQTPAGASNKPVTDSLGLHSQSPSSDDSDAHLVLTPTLTFSNHNDVRVMLQKSSISGQLVVTRDLLLNASDRARELWKEEQSIHARLSHPNIVRVISTSAERIVLEHANACDLRAFSKRKLPLGIPTGLKEGALRPILKALQYLHEQEVAIPGSSYSECQMRFC